MDLVLSFLRLVLFRTVDLCAPRVLNNFCFLSWYTELSISESDLQKPLISCSLSDFKSSYLYAVL